MGRKAGSLYRYRCGVCTTVELAPGGSKAFRCLSCKAAGRFPYKPDRTWLGRPVAGRLVRAAIICGQLPHPRTLRCVDCGGEAAEYEHRDYNAPLTVDPTCRSCNLKRGPAIPLVGSVELMLAQGKFPYRNRSAAQKLCAVMGRPDLGAGLPPRLSLTDWQRIWPELTKAAA